jgi:hypothetical protein
MRKLVQREEDWGNILRVLRQEREYGLTEAARRETHLPDVRLISSSSQRQATLELLVHGAAQRTFELAKEWSEGRRPTQSMACFNFAKASSYGEQDWHPFACSHIKQSRHARDSPETQNERLRMLCRPQSSGQRRSGDDLCHHLSVSFYL